MARIDVPTMRCDRCGWVTTNEHEVSMFTSVEWYSDPVAQKRERPDLCKQCCSDFTLLFMKNLHAFPSKRAETNA